MSNDNWTALAMYLTSLENRIEALEFQQQQKEQKGGWEWPDKYN
jgi:hypothetical protein